MATGPTHPHPRPAPPPEPRDDARLTAREEAAIAQAVVRVGRRDRGPVVVVALVAAAFLLGVVRPWDLLRGGPEPGRPAASPGVPGTGVAGTGVAGDPPATGAGGPSASPDTGQGGTPPDREPACGYPSSWRTAAVMEWAGHPARVWTAARAVTATGPADPAIPFHPIASDVVEAIGWCAPVGGDDRPPLAAQGTLYRLRDGVATEVRVDRLAPAGPDALGELWLPRPPPAGRRPAWSPGRYVIRLATPSGTYVRYLGLEVGVASRPSPSPSPVPGSPGASPSPGSPAPGSPGGGSASPASPGASKGAPDAGGG